MLYKQKINKLLLRNMYNLYLYIYIGIHSIESFTDKNINNVQ